MKNRDRLMGTRGSLVVVGATWLCAAMLVGGPNVARAQTGVSDDRVSLPEGPGSLEGVGENVEIDPNMGTMHYAYKISVPKGYPNMTPSVDLSYNSGAGGSVVGMGWSMPMPSIERMTARGLPEYDLADEFVAEGSDQLVLIPGSDPPVYRSRFEKGFVRYTWLDAGTGAEGYWRAELPDGRISYYGADSQGTLVTAARVSGTAGTFRYFLVDTVDRYGHHLHYSYSLFGNVTLPLQIGWVYVGGQPRYSVTFQYEDRMDMLSDCKPGFEELLTKRLVRVNVLSGTTRIRHYDLAYEDEATSGGFSRLVSVQRFGKDDGAYPAHESYTYSRALGVQCQTGQDCLKPYTVDMGSIGVSLLSGDSALIDINGDALPDIVDTSNAGAPQRFFVNRLHADGTHTFDAPIQSAVGTQSSHDLSSPYVQVMDVDGDGHTDMINSQNGQVLRNRGTGDWAEAYSLWTSGNGGVPDLSGDFDPSDGQLRTVRFIDYDGDKKIDLIRSMGADASNVTTVFRNLGTGGFQSDPNVAMMGVGFEVDSVELNDINGDGLLDVVQVLPSMVRYRLNLGWGHWDAWQEIQGFSFTDQEAIDAELEDINGDGLTDLVLVAGNEVRYWINRNGASYDPVRVVTSANIDGDLPVRTSQTVVLFADMNGNGSNDIVWIDVSGHVIYLELFPVRPNLISRIENGLGKVSAVTYGTSAEHMARDGGPGAWPHALPHSMQVVDMFDTWNELALVHDTTEYSYHDGFYDGAEKQFRGFSRVEQFEPADATKEEGLAFETYDVGLTDTYRNGLLLTREIRGAAGRLLQYQENSYADCDVDGVPTSGLLFAVRSICQTGELLEKREERPPAEWVRTQKNFSYDGYGNRTLEASLGVTSIGGGGCPACTTSGYAGTPCGAQCLGDESYVSTEYAQPTSNSDRWFLRSPIRKREFGVANGSGEPANQNYSETLTYYDGPEFVGLALGQVTNGTAARVTERATAAGTVNESKRSKLDTHGNIIESLDALGAPDGTAHRRIYTMDADGLRVIRTELLLEDDQGSYRLRRDLEYHALFDSMTSATNWMLVRNNSVVSDRNAITWGYDEFGRVISATKPGETSGMTTEEYTWELGSPSSRAIVRSRSQAGGAFDVEKVQCFDGHGKKYQERTRIAAGSYKVTGVTYFNTKGDEVTVYQPYTSTSGNCDHVPPTGTEAVSSEFDALGRVVRQRFPDADPGDGEDAVNRYEFLPLTEISYDLEDTYQQGSHTNTPTTKRFNGLDKLIATEHLLAAGGTPLVYRYRWDELGNVAALVDPAGNMRQQTFNLLGDVVRVDDPDRGVTTSEYDAAGNLVRVVDARSKARRLSYDGANRKVAEWDEADETGTKISIRYDSAGACPANRCSNVSSQIAETRYPLGDGSFGQDRWGYNAEGKQTYLGRLVAGRLLELATGYDRLGRVTSETFPTGLRIDYQLNGEGNITGVPGYVSDVVYDPRGGIASLTLGNGVLVSNAYDQLMRIAEIGALGPGNQKVLAYTYRRDREGNILEITDGRPDDGQPLGGAGYQYDALYRLTEAQLDPARSAHAETLSYQYDAIGNLTAKTSSRGSSSSDHVGTLEYGAGGAGPGAVTSAGDIDLTYDAAGNVVTRGADRFTWDYLGRLQRTDHDDGSAATYVYSDSTDRVLKRDKGRTTYYLTTHFETRDGVATTYIMLGETRVVRIEEPDFAAQLLSDVAPATGADDAITATPDQLITAGDAWIAQAVESDVVIFASTTEVSPVADLLEASLKRLLEGDDRRVRYLHHDHLGGTVAESDETGAVVDRTEYYPYGVVRYETNADQYYRFAGKERDLANGLVYFGARYYDPWTTRWTAPDPHFDSLDDKSLERGREAAGSYVYTLNNPVDNVDTNGKWVTALVTAVTTIVAQPFVGAVGGALSQVRQNWNKDITKGEKWARAGIGAGIGAAAGLIGGLIAGGVAMVGAILPDGADAWVIGAAIGITVASLAVTEVINQGASWALDAILSKRDTTSAKGNTTGAGAGNSPSTKTTTTGPTSPQNQTKPTTSEMGTQTDAQPGASGPEKIANKTPPSLPSKADRPSLAQVRTDIKYEKAAPSTKE